MLQVGHEEKLIRTEHEEHKHDHEHKEHAEKLIHAHIAYVEVAHETIISLLASVFHLRQDLILHWYWTKVSYLILSIIEWRHMDDDHEDDENRFQGWLICFENQKSGHIANLSHFLSSFHSKFSLHRCQDFCRLAIPKNISSNLASQIFLEHPGFVFPFIENRSYDLWHSYNHALTVPVCEIWIITLKEYDILTYGVQP